MNLCRRCYIKHHELKKKDSKQLTSTAEKYQCDMCGEYKSIVIVKPKEKDFYEEEY